MNTISMIIIILIVFILLGWEGFHAEWNGTVLQSGAGMPVPAAGLAVRALRADDPLWPARGGQKRAVAGGAEAVRVSLLLLSRGPPHASAATGVPGGILPRRVPGNLSAAALHLRRRPARFAGPRRRAAATARRRPAGLRRAGRAAVSGGCRAGTAYCPAALVG